MTAQIIPFRRPAPTNPIFDPFAQYFIGMAMVGIIAMAWMEQMASLHRPV